MVFANGSLYLPRLSSLQLGRLECVVNNFAGKASTHIQLHAARIMAGQIGRERNPILYPRFRESVGRRLLQMCRPVSKQCALVPPGLSRHQYGCPHLPSLCARPPPAEPKPLDPTTIHVASVASPPRSRVSQGRCAHSGLLGPSPTRRCLIFSLFFPHLLPQNCHLLLRVLFTGH